MIAITEAFSFSAYVQPAEVAQVGGDVAPATCTHASAPPDEESTREPAGGVLSLLRGTSDRIPSPFLPSALLCPGNAHQANESQF